MFWQAKTNKNENVSREINLPVLVTLQLSQVENL